MKFSASHAAFEGFRVTRQHPRAVAVWAVFSTLILVATFFTALPILGPAFDELKAAIVGGGQLSSDVQMRMAYATLALLPLNLVSQAILLPAIYRAMASDLSDRFGFVRVGRDELRVLGVLVILALISLVIGQAAALVAGLAAMAGLGFVGAAIEGAAMVFSVVYLPVRLVLAAPGSFAKGRIDMRSAWETTSGLFWPLLGLAILSGVMAIIVVMLLSIVALPLSNAGGGFAEMSPLSLAAGAGLLIVGGVTMTLTTTIVSAPFMAVYRELSRS